MTAVVNAIRPAIKRRQKGIRLSEEKRQDREENIIKMRSQGQSNIEIAKTLGLKVGTISNLAHKFIKNGRIKPQWHKEATWRNLDHKRTRTIIALRKKRATLNTIGDAIGVTRERARQLINKIANEHGYEVFNSNTPLYTSREAEKILNIWTGFINKLCKRGEVVYQCRGVGKNKTYLIDEVELRKPSTHPAVTRKQICETCGKVFTLRPYQSKRTACPEMCLDESRRQKRADYTKEYPTLNSLVGWHQDLWQKLQSHRIRKNEEWITITEAALRTGLSEMQLIWLRHRNIVAIRPHNFKKWRGQPVATYAASEMQIAQQVLGHHQHKEKIK